MNDNIIAVPLFGYLKLETRMRPVPGGLIGEGRSLQYDLEHTY